MNYGKYLWYMGILRIIVVIHFSYAADFTKQMEQLPRELYPHIIAHTNFFGQQRERIYNNTILPHELVGTIQLAFTLQNIDFLAAVEMRRFVHKPTRARMLIYDEKPILLIDLLKTPVENKALVRTNLLHHLATCTTSYKPCIPFYIPSGKNLKAYYGHEAGSPHFLKPILRCAEKPYLFVLHADGYSTIIKKRGTQTLEHMIFEKYASFACGSNPWPLVIRTEDGQTLSLNLTDDETLIESEATDAESTLLERTTAKSEITALYNDVINDASYALPLEIMPDHYELKTYKNYYINGEKPIQYGFYDKKSSHIYLLTIDEDEVLHIDTFTLPHLIRNNNGMDRLLLCAISGYKNMQCRTSDESWSIVSCLTEAIITQFSPHENEDDDDTKYDLCQLIQTIHNKHLQRLKYEPDIDDSAGIVIERCKIPLEQYE